MLKWRIRPVWNREMQIWQPNVFAAILPASIGVWDYYGDIQTAMKMIAEHEHRIGLVRRWRTLHDGHNAF